MLKAFVGHSFNEADREIVRSFLDFFGKVVNMGIGFTWEHAESAEPKELSLKVKKKMEGKNLFIGICTPRESVIDTEKLTPFPFSKARVWSSKNNFQDCGDIFLSPVRVLDSCAIL